MILRTLFVPCLLLTCFARFAWAQNTATAPSRPSRTVPLTVEQGFPLPVIVTTRVRFKQNEPVTARLAEPVYAFDRDVIPAGTEVGGRIIGFQAAPRWRRLFAILNGDFTPLREPQMQFDTLVLKDGTRLPIQTTVEPGGDTIVRFDSGGSSRKKGKIATAKATARDQIDLQKRAVISLVKEPGKIERLKNILWGFAPYHPQSVAAGSRFKASLLMPLEFGTVVFEEAQLSQVGSVGTDSLGMARLALMVASRAGDDGNADRFSEGRAEGIVYRNNFAGRIVGGALGFGILGGLLGRLSRPFGVGLGFYGAARSIYFNVLARGKEVSFPVDTSIELKFSSSSEREKESYRASRTEPYCWPECGEYPSPVSVVGIIRNSRFSSESQRQP